jgi:hypothetical protein
VSVGSEGSSPVSECSGKKDWAMVVMANRQPGHRSGSVVVVVRGVLEDYSMKRYVVEGRYGCRVRYSP